jgi:hypothetical protein
MPKIQLPIQELEKVLRYLEDSEDDIEWAMDEPNHILNSVWAVRAWLNILGDAS